MKNLFRLMLLFFAANLFFTGLYAQQIRGTYAIKNVQTGKLLRIKDANGKNGTPLVAYSPINWKCMTWDFKHVEGNTYQLKNLFTSKTFQPKAGTPSDGIELEQQPLVNAQANQLYEFNEVKKDVYLIKAKGTDLYLTPVDKDGTIDTGIKLAAKDGSALQQWAIYEQHPTM